MGKLIKLGVSIGDINGVGLEIILKSFKDKVDAEAFIRQEISHGTEIDDTNVAKIGTKRKQAFESENLRTDAATITKKQRKLPYVKQKIHIMFDGGARGNPGLGGAGATVTFSRASSISHANGRSGMVDAGEDRSLHKTIFIRHFVGTNATNNQAEYKGLIVGLQMAIREAVEYNKKDSSIDDSGKTATTHLAIQGDSNLIIQQLQGTYKCRNQKLKPLFEQTKRLLQKVRTSLEGQVVVRMEHVFRDSNKEADFLANQAMDEKRSWYTTSDDNHKLQNTWPPALDNSKILRKESI